MKTKSFSLSYHFKHRCQKILLLSRKVGGVPIPKSEHAVNRPPSRSTARARKVCRRIGMRTAPKIRILFSGAQEERNRKQKEGSIGRERRAYSGNLELGSLTGKVKTALSPATGKDLFRGQKRSSPRGRQRRFLQALSPQPLSFPSTSPHLPLHHQFSLRGSLYE